MDETEDYVKDAISVVARYSYDVPEEGTVYRCALPSMPLGEARRLIEAEVRAVLPENAHNVVVAIEVGGDWESETPYHQVGYSLDSGDDVK